MFDKTILLQHIENRQRTAAEQSQIATNLDELKMPEDPNNPSIKDARKAGAARALKIQDDEMDKSMDAMGRADAAGVQRHRGKAMLAVDRVSRRGGAVSGDSTAKVGSGKRNRNSQNQSIENAASHVHDEWMRRNPREDWNASQHVPYNKLPEEEKAKDRAHVNHISGILRSNNLDPHNEEHHGEIVDNFGSIAHEEWRGSHREQRGNVPREKKTKAGETVDINVPYSKLHPEYKVENEAAGRAALDAFRKHMT